MVLVLLDRFLIIIGLGLMVSFVFLIAGAYYLVKMYYFMQMSDDMSKASGYIVRIFFYGIFSPIMALFFANDMGIPLFARPTEQQMAAYHAGNLVLINHTLNTGALYLVIMGIIGMTYAVYYFYEKRFRQDLSA